MNYIEIKYINPLDKQEYSYRIKEKDIINGIYDDYDGGINHPIKIISAQYIEEGESIMALRVRKNGKIVCANDYPAEEGDIYINDAIHEFLGGCTDRGRRVIFYNREKDRWTFYPTKKIIEENT